MGLVITWVAFKGVRGSRVHEALGLHRTGDRECRPHSPLLGKRTRSGWYVVVARWSTKNGPWWEDDVLMRVSEGCDVVTGSVAESDGFSEATGWRDGVETWALSRHPDVNHGDLGIQGTLPPEAVRASRRFGLLEVVLGPIPHARVPVRLARLLTGFHHRCRGYEVLARLPARGENIN